MHCHKCRSPLKLDGSLEGLNPAAYDLLLSSAPQQALKKTSSSRPAYPTDHVRKSAFQKAASHASSANFSRAGGGRDSSMSFIVLSESQLGQPPTQRPGRTSPQLGGRGDGSSDGRDQRESSEGSTVPVDRGFDMARVNRLHEILSARSDIDHPICVECSDLLVAGLQKKMESGTAERDAYVRFLKDSDQADQPSAEEIRAQEESLKRALADEADATAALKKLEKEKAAMDAERLALEEEGQLLDKEEEQFWRDRNAFASRLSEFQSERDSINTKYNHDAGLLHRLARTNVFNETFYISYDGTFGTINGLRLGRLSSKPVDWPEINAAWGHALLLIVMVAEKVQYRFEGYEAKPMGSTSKIFRYELPSPSSSRLGGHRNTAPPPPKKHILELYSSGDVLGLIGINRSLNAAMVAFLELVRQLGAFVRRQMEAHHKELDLPHKIEGDKINNVSIKLGIAGDESWTQACKFTLTCCKFLLAAASELGYMSGNAGNAS